MMMKMRMIWTELKMMKIKMKGKEDLLELNLKLELEQVP
jgi:hypothetical protein